MKGAKMSDLLYKKCNLCARRCGVDRTVSAGYCRMKNEIYLSRAALHFWEEPPISGEHGSGAIFFAGCSLSCIYCQNREISRGRAGKAVTVERLCEIMLDLQRQGAHNINFVTPTHYIPSVADAIKLARSKGLTIPIVYNTGSYDTPEALKILEGLVDIYLPDLKYYTPRTANEYSSAKDYPEVARDAIAEMYRQVGRAQMDGEGMMTRGVIVRILLLPGHVAEAKLSLKYLMDTYGDSIYISLMNQYTPMPDMPSPLNRKVTRDEYEQLLDYAEKLGLKNGFTQEFGTASESFIPPFDNTGI
jgi:putative pyruvate formate lyase activating enzyme